ncbi:MAG: glycosyltransferase [Clostridium sp.]|nr:glycosyltransferase [Clostridium sp.]
MASLKQELKRILIQRQHKRYERELASKNLSYDGWIRQQEKKLNIPTLLVTEEKKLINEIEPANPESYKRKKTDENSKKGDFFRIMGIIDETGQYFQDKITAVCLSVEQLPGHLEEILEQYSPDIFLISMYEGKLSKIALPLICREFCRNPKVQLLYGDEDTLRDFSGASAGIAGLKARELDVSQAGGQKKNTVRENPWFKPDWSPDRFLSCFYFGGLVALRAAALREALRKRTESAESTESTDNIAGVIYDSNTDKNASAEWFYGFLFEILKDAEAFAARRKAAYLSESFSENFSENSLGGSLESRPVCPSESLLICPPVCHIPQVLFHNTGDGYQQIKELHLPANGEILEKEAEKPGEKTEKPLLTIIIPSKDNPEALFHCLDSLLARTITEYPFEIVLIDNGSSEENREKILQKVHKLNQRKTYSINESRTIAFRGCRYFHQVMPFNFSKMCNLGAEKGKGEFYLFLNDDMEIIQPDWLDKMAEKALLPYAGAVGAKLLYPDSTTIQHAGITNLRVGPAHKLQYLDDRTEHYFGMNRGVHDMLAVTGACLMVRKNVFLQAGGFSEELAVAFNDVDLCYRIFEKGYYNIERNDVILYHHESLSRGNDGDSPEKQLRLLREKDILYERHQDIYGKDPFYHPYLATDMLEREYSPACRYQVTLDMPWAEPIADKGEVQKAREDKCLVVGMECAMDIYKWQYGVSPEKGKVKPVPGEMGYYFQGYSFVIGADNACYKKRLLLRNKETGRTWAVPVDNRYRQDIKNNLEGQENVDLTGFAAKMRRNTIPAGVYQFGMLAEDMCSRQRLVNWSNWVLEVTADEK